jgi:hypothetical protein
VRSEKARNRKLKALLKALDETGLNSGTIVTCEDEEEVTTADNTIHVVPAYKYFHGAGAR